MFRKRGDIQTPAVLAVPGQCQGGGESVVVVVVVVLVVVVVVVVVVIVVMTVVVVESWSEIQKIWDRDTM